MTVSTKSLILILGLFALTAFSAPAAINPKKIYCDAKNRPASESCYSQDFVSTCGYYKQNCPLEICGRPSSNACDACQDPNVLYYVAGDCKPAEIVNQCPEYDTRSSSSSSFPFQNEGFFPVCGIRKNCKNGDCTTTFDNVNQACKSSTYGWYQDGVCEDDKTYCTARQRNANCNGVRGSTVCAFFTDKDGVERYTTVRSGCNACQDSAVKYYKAGECGVNLDNRTYCLPTRRPDACTREYNPVCGFFIPEDYNNLDHKIYSNPCTACQDPEVTNYQAGACVFTCQHNPFLIVECSGTTVQPVCGTYKTNGKTQKASLQNSCLACNNVPMKIDTYTDGLCPGDEGILCKNYAGGFVQGMISPVCGATKLGCNSTSCQITYAEPGAACQDSKVVLFKPGKCPGDEGISCTPYRAQNSQVNSLQFQYQDVCGYTRKGCTSRNCRQTYTNQTVACEKNSVLFFTEGPCQ